MRKPRGTHVVRIHQRLDGTWRFNIFRQFPRGGEALAAMGICDFTDPNDAIRHGRSVAEHMTFMMGWVE